MIQALVDAAQGGCRGGNPAFVDTGVDDIDQALVADVFVGGSGEHGFLPTEFLRVAEADALVKHLTGHLGSGILYFVPRAAVIGIRRFEGFGGLEVDGYDEFSRLIRDFDVLSGKVDGRREFPEGVGDVLTCLVGHVLSEKCQLLGMDAEEEPTALGVEESAAGLHPGGKFAGGFLGFHDAVLVPLYDGFYFLYGQFFHGLVFLWITKIQLFGGYLASKAFSIRLMASRLADSVMSMYGFIDL